MKISLDNNDISIIIDRLMTYINAKNETELAHLLGMSQQAFNACINRGSFPFKQVIPFCINRGISLDWLFGVNNDLIKSNANTDQAKEDKPTNTDIREVAAAASSENKSGRSGGIGRRARFRV